MAKEPKKSKSVDNREPLFPYLDPRNRAEYEQHQKERRKAERKAKKPKAKKP